MTGVKFQRWLSVALLSASLALPAIAPAQESVLAPYDAIARPDNRALLPVLNPRNGQIEALLLLESSSPAAPRSPLDRVIGPDRNRAPLIQNRHPLGASGAALSSALTLEANTGLALLCDSSAVLSTLGSLAEHCLLTQLDGFGNDPLLTGHSIGLGSRVSLEGNGARLSLDASVNRGQLAPETIDFGLPSYLAGGLPGSGFAGLGYDYATAFGSGPLGGSGLFYNRPFLGAGSSGRFDLERLGLAGVMRLGHNGWVSIGGAMARAHLIPTQSYLPGPLNWNISEFTLGGGYGAFSGAITSRVIKIPGQSGSFNDLDIGLTWRTPWAGQLSIGARNQAGPGEPANAFGLPNLDVRGDDGEATIPYVRYRQDL